MLLKHRKLFVSNKFTHNNFSAFLKRVGSSSIQIVQNLLILYYHQKRPPSVFYKKRCSLKFHKFHRKTPVLESLFNGVPGLKACDFIEKRLQHRCFPVKFAKYLRRPILKNICKRLLLNCILLTSLFTPFPSNGNGFIYFFYLGVISSITTISFPHINFNKHTFKPIRRITLSKKIRKNIISYIDFITYLKFLE